VDHRGRRQRWKQAVADLVNAHAPRRPRAAGRRGQGDLGVVGISLLAHVPVRQPSEGRHVCDQCVLAQLHVREVHLNGHHHRPVIHELVRANLDLDAAVSMEAPSLDLDPRESVRRDAVHDPIHPAVIQRQKHVQVAPGGGHQARPHQPLRHLAHREVAHPHRLDFLALHPPDNACSACHRALRPVRPVFEMLFASSMLHWLV
jgi:hypothetical protein